jgi:RNA polymerase sigma-32 factor
VKPTEVREMEQRMGGRDLSLDAPMGEDGSSTHMDFVASSAAGQDEEVADRAGGDDQRPRPHRPDSARPRERFIIEQRVMNERPMTLKELGEHFGFSRERARQLEIRAKDKLKAELAALMAEVEPEAAA